MTFFIMMDFNLLNILFINLFLISTANLETLHFESACLQSTNQIQFNLQCSKYEHIQIIRVIYGYTKQIHSLQECQFSIYDCIQEGTSEKILSCNGKQTCLIYLTKDEILATAISTPGVPTCPDFNYVQVNFACIPDSKDICDSWKDEGQIIHLSHIFSKERQMNSCHCKIRSSMSNGQVLLRVKEINIEQAMIQSKSSDIDCKQATYLEIVTDRMERKCMNIIPSNANALFGSGSHNFSLNYVRKDHLSELFFYFELKASPIRKDHHVQIICNWKRHQIAPSMTMTTVPISTTPPPLISTTIPITKKRRKTTLSMDNGSKLSRLDLIRHRPGSQDDHIDLEETTTIVEEQGEEEVEENAEEEEQEQQQQQEEEVEEEILTTTIPIKTKKPKRKHTSIETTTLTSTTSDDDEEWLRIISLAETDSQLAPSKQLLSINNRTFINTNQPSIIHTNTKLHQRSSASHRLLLIFIFLILLTFIVLLIYCFKVKQPDCFQRIRLNTNIAIIFCCEAGKLLFGSTKKSPEPNPTTTNSPTNTIDSRHRHYRPSTSMPDYQSSAYYLDETGNDNCHPTQSIYDGGGKSIYSIDYDEETEYTTKYGRHQDCGSC